jgi:hypothetical protein
VRDDKNRTLPLRPNIAVICRLSTTLELYRDESGSDPDSIILRGE